LAGLIGALPITQVIVRSSANIQAGGKTRAATFVHGLLLLVSTLLIPQLLNKIPLASPALYPKEKTGQKLGSRA
ncbi:MAG: SulP family inorganic anion transporter, partial [Burkholderiales bacterium]